MTAVEQSIGAALRAQFRAAHGTLEGTLQGVTSEQLHWTPPGRAMPIAAHYGHVICGEDLFFNVLFQGGGPVARTTKEGQTGISEPPPPGDWSEWARRVRVELPTAHGYAEAVYAATDAFLATLTPEDLSRPVDLSMVGLGTMALGDVINGSLLNIAWHSGEIACLKGLQGERGYPM